MQSFRSSGIALCVLALAAFVLAPGAAESHVATLGLAGKKIGISTSKGLDKQKFSFKTDKGLPFPVGDPVAFGSSVLVVGAGADIGKSELVTLDPLLWTARGNPPGAKGYSYKDKAGTRGGITKVKLQPGSISITAKGTGWTWAPAGAQDSVTVYFSVGTVSDPEFERYCVQFGGDITKNEAGTFKAKKSAALVSCPDEICGNGVHELGEECDDGNNDDADGCNADCTQGECVGQAYDSTYDALQANIFDSPIYSCTSSLCHDAIAPQGGLDLTVGSSYPNLVDVAALASLAGHDLVEPGDKDSSFLYDKLQAGVNMTLPGGGSAMPVGSALTADHLEALRLWIQGGAPETGSVAGTEDLLDGCLPDPTPLTIPVPDAPGAGNGVQLWSNPWDLVAQSEDEVCFGTYYDFTNTGLIPESAKFPCPTVCETNLLLQCDSNADCGGDACVPGSINNPSGECFRYHSLGLHQDPQSHHAFVRSYLGAGDTTNFGWGQWTYKFQDKSNPLQDQTCDPLSVDPSLGYNPGCSSQTISAVACLGQGPGDLSQGSSLSGATGSGTTPTFTGSGTPVFEQEYADGVYSVLPMQGVMVWNSHAFNLTDVDATMSIYLNLNVADPVDQLYQLEGIFDAQAIFAQNAPPFGTEELCRSWTAPQGANIFMLTSHTHQWGVRWRTWGPPNADCGTECTARGDTPLYISTEYTDPLNQFFDPPMVLDSANPDDRTFLYCSLYDNGSTITSPPVKQQSTAVVPPLVFGLPLGPGGPCGDAAVACLNNGPNRGELCAGDDAFCDSFPGAGDGQCDACPVRGGVTTSDEMFILQGLMFVVPPGP